MKEKSWTQQEVAQHAGVDQSTICRLLRADPKRLGPAHRKVIAFLQSHAYLETDDSVRAELVRACESAWDGTAEHAEAMIAVLGALPIVRLKA